MEQRLEQAAAITGRLAHDFGNYLTGILGFTELSISHASADTPQFRYLQEVLQSAQQGAAWIHRLQLFCRRNAGPTWPTCLPTLLSAEEARIRAAQAPNVNVEFNVPGDLPLLEIDAGALQLAIQEIVSNALEATKGRVAINFAARSVELTPAECHEILGAARSGPCVELSITDDGPGISAQDRGKIFREVFFSTKPRGRGVGLLVVYGILRRFHGGLRLETAGQQRGVSARLYVPVATTDAPTLVTGPKPPNVLLAHTNPLVFDSLRIILEATGCKVTAPDSPQTALSAFTTPRTSFALVVIDATMPQVSAFDFARRILDHDSEANILFLHTQPSYHGAAEEELLSRFDMVRWPLQTSTVLQAVQKAMTRTQEPARK